MRIISLPHVNLDLNLRYLVEEDVFSVACLVRMVLQLSVGADAVFLAQLLPKLHPD